MAKASNKFTLKVLMDKWKSFTSKKATFNFGDEHPVVLEFEGLCHYDQVYQHGDIYCPQCGEQSVWFDKECEDNQNLCVSCNHYFDLDRLMKMEPARLHVAYQIVSGLTIDPSTPTKKEYDKKLHKKEKHEHK